MMRIRHISSMSTPNMLAVAGLFFLPFMDFRPPNILFTLSDFLFLLSGLVLLARQQLSLSYFGAVTPLWFACVALMLGALFLSSLANGSEERWASVAMQYAFSLLVLPAILLFSERSRWVLSARAFVWGVVAMEVIAFAILNYYGWSYEEIRSRFGREFLTGNRRVSAFMGGANLHAAILCMSLPFAFYLRATRRMSRPLFAFAVGMISLGIFYSASVTGFISLIAVSIVFYLIAQVRISPQLLAGAAAILAAFSYFNLSAPASFEKRVGSALETGNFDEAGTFAHRLELMKEAWSMADDAMVTGVGADNYRDRSELGAPVHNTYLLLWVEGGFPALIGWTGIVALLGLAGLSILQGRPLDAAVALSVFTAFLIFTMTAPHMYARVWIAPVLLALGPAFAMNRRAAEPWRPGPRPSPMAGS